MTFDGRGNMTSDGQTSFGYDFSNRLVSASRAGMSASYRYDENDRRVTKTVNGTSTTTLWSSFGEDLSETGTYSTAQAVRYIRGLGVDNRLASVDLYGTVTWYYRDRLGSVIAASNSAGAITATSAYSPHGELPAGQTPAGGSFGYAGRQFDAETGLYYNRARYYHPRLGQFMQTDPIGMADDANLYGYVGQDPLNATDPSGTDACLNGTTCMDGIVVQFGSGIDPNHNDVGGDEIPFQISGLPRCRSTARVAARVVPRWASPAHLVTRCE